MSFPYFWQATYEGGTQTTSDDTPYEALNRRALRSFAIVDRESRAVPIHVQLEPGDRLIWRKREQMRTDGTVETAHLVCREHLRDGYSERFIKLLMQNDGRIIICGQYDPTDPWLIEPVLLDCEL